MKRILRAVRAAFSRQRPVSRGRARVATGNARSPKEAEPKRRTLAERRAEMLNDERIVTTLFG